MTTESVLSLAQKKQKLLESLRRYPSLGVAFSGGVDSTLLLAAAVTVCGDRVVAMTARSPIHPAHETEAAAQLARRIGARHLILDTDEWAAPAFAVNSAQRCYHCKKILFETMRRCAARENLTALAHGANADDLADFRPGFVAAQEMGVHAPLITAGLTKVEIRRLAREMGLPNWDRPAMACLATRIPYGVEIRRSLLGQIERAEAVLTDVGLDACRVRHHGSLARIEIDVAQMALLMVGTTRQRVVEALRGLGFTYVALDLEGYVSGKMNRELSM